MAAGGRNCFLGKRSGLGSVSGKAGRIPQRLRAPPGWAAERCSGQVRSAAGGGEGMAGQDRAGQGRAGQGAPVRGRPRCRRSARPAASATGQEAGGGSHCPCPGRFRLIPVPGVGDRGRPVVRCRCRCCRALAEPAASVGSAPAGGEQQRQPVLF